MKRLLAVAGSFLLLFAAAGCTAGAIISAFSFDIDIIVLFPVWLLAALALSVSVSFLRFKGLLLLVPPALIALLLKLPEIVNGGKSAVCHITSEYNKWLFVPVVFPNARASTHEMTLFFAFFGVALIFLLSASVCIHRSAFLSVLYTAPFVLLTVVLIESVPDVRFLLGLLTVYMTLAISSSLHPVNSLERGTGVFPALALSFVLLVAAYIVSPPNSYRRSGFLDVFDNYLRDTAEQIGADLNRKGVGWPQNVSSGWRFSDEHVEIANAGTRLITGRALLEITASQPGTFYLRGFSLQSFDGRAWSHNSDEQPIPVESFYRRMPALIAETYCRYYPDGAPAVASMSIDRTGEISDMIYQPYFSLPIQKIDGYPYAVDFYYTKMSIPGMYSALSPSEKSIVAESAAEYDSGALFGYNAQVQSPWAYTSVEDSTGEGLRKLAIDAGIDPDANRAEIADMVAEYISMSARYTLTPRITPEGEDFALYFLQKSKQGYCIHFATAAVLMLRALDIPARFAGGFVATVRAGDAGEAVQITDRNAHAWVEVYYDDVGWIPLEVTPAYPGSGIPAGTLHNSAPELTPINPFEDESQPIEPSGDTTIEESGDPDIETGTPQTPGIGAQSDAGTNASLERQNGSILVAASLAAACILALALFIVLIPIHRKKRLSSADANEVVLFAWRLISRLSRYGKPPENMEEIALKARFSLHDITNEEREEMFESFLLYCADIRKRRNPVLRLRIKYILLAMP